MGSMTKDEINVSLFGEVQRQRGEIEALKAALQRFRDYRTRALNGLEFVGVCDYCLVGNQPGTHHLTDCKAFKEERQEDDMGFGRIMPGS